MTSTRSKDEEIRSGEMFIEDMKEKDNGNVAVRRPRS
jgi:hypothetical protein